MGNGVATLKKRDLIVTLLYFLCLRVHFVENLSGALGVCFHARCVYSRGMRYELIDSLCPHQNCTEISLFCAECVYYGGSAFRCWRSGRQNGAQNAQTQAVERYYTKVKPQQYHDNRCR